MTELERLKAKDEAVRVLQRALLHIDGLPEDVNGHYGNSAIFMRDSKTLKQVTDQLTLFRKLNGNYKVEGYAMYGSSKLQVTYLFGNGVTVHFYVEDYESALNILSDGKCKIIRETIPPSTCNGYDSIRVECPLGGNQGDAVPF